MALRFVTAKNLNEYINEDNMLASWGGKDDYQFKFTPEQRSGSSSDDTTNGRNELAMQKDENDNTTFSDNNNNNNNNNVKKVCAHDMTKVILENAENWRQNQHKTQRNTNSQIDQNREVFALINR